MSRKAIFASLLSLFVPGLGQIYSGNDKHGVLILLASILIVNLNAIWLSLYGMTSPGTDAFWKYRLPRILHDLCGVWSMVFYFWQILDSYRHAE